MEERSLSSKIALLFVYGILAVVSLVGNVVIIVIYFKWKSTFKIYKVTYIFLLSLTVANLMIACAVMPLSLVSVFTEKWIFGHTMCVINGFIFTWMATVTILTVLLISFHRATVVLCPLKRLIKTGVARCLAGSVWFLALVVPVPPLGGVSQYEYSPTRAFCRVRFVSEEDTLGNIYSLMTVSLFVVLPLIVICIANIVLYRVSLRLLQSDGHLNSQGLGKTDGGARRMSKTIRGELKALTTVTLVMGIFVVCWAPQIILTVYGIVTKEPTLPALQTLQAVCVFSNTACNPFIYIYANKDTRKRFAEMFCNRHRERLISFKKFNNRCSTISLSPVGRSDNQMSVQRMRFKIPSIRDRLLITSASISHQHQDSTTTSESSNSPACASSIELKS